MEPQMSPSPRPPLSPNPARKNHGGSQDSSLNPPGSSGLGLLQRSKQQNVRTRPPGEVEGNNIILHRAQHFLLRTAYRPGQTVAPFRRGATLPKVMPQQGEHSSLDAMSVPSANNFANKRGQLSVPRWLEVVVVMIGLLAIGIIHTLNIFNYPRYQPDEGTYMASTWAILHGQLWPYAYGYGHPPAGWMQIAAWVQLTGGLFTFGNAVNSGRVLMVLYAVGSTLLVYLIVRRFGGSRSTAFLAMAMFSLSPLGIGYQRQVLLDNVATFWFLVSLYLIVVSNSRLLYIVLSAVALGISFLSKEVMVLFIPAMVYAVWLHTTQFQRKFAMVAFTYSVIAVCSAYILMAVLKGELFPPGWLPWDHNHQHLSLTGTLLSQTKRTGSEGGFGTSFLSWLHDDRFLLLVSIVATAFNLLIGWWNRKQLLLAALAISFWLLLIRGGVVFTFYIIPLLPLMAINITMAIHTIVGWLSRVVRFDFVRVVLILGVLGAIVSYDLTNTGFIFTQHPTSSQDQAITWVRQNIPHNDFIVINSYMFADLHEPGGTGVGDGATYPYAHLYENVATDPAIRYSLLGNNPDRIDYIVADSGMLSDVNSQPLYKFVAVALKQSVLVAKFTAPEDYSNDVIQIFEVKHNIAQPVVSTAPSGGRSSTNVAFDARGTIPMDRRLYIG